MSFTLEFIIGVSKANSKTDESPKSGEEAPPNTFPCECCNEMFGSKIDAMLHLRYNCRAMA
ncbi:hypothetical protein DL89DRAFT_270264 [Linderina pennispora]|uniref:C2H2-type domain-containing protein n=1 Tax=Linderina pennispora TaxID=61395 RepID=A0A1Y1VYL5_9FUNG|nr:uncharacterized protein DL89DRAFT_270264 [Linderina pennispora]ORX66343.1 hypothetical protein DL89DRAFT_270264 [Linderina pennispora]